jgi:hypothetical protein
MAKVRRKDGQSVSLWDDPSASTSALKQNMNTLSAKKESAETISRLEKLVTISPKAGALKIALVYEDAQTREWAGETYERVGKIAGKQGVRPTWWNLANLGEPGVLAAAVSTAMRADVIVVAALAGEGMPLAFYAWVNSWLPNRISGGGVLTALLGKTERPNARPTRVGEYLREVARQARMSFVLDARKLQGEVNGANGHAQIGLSNAAVPVPNRTLASIRF